VTGKLGKKLTKRIQIYRNPDLYHVRVEASTEQWLWGTHKAQLGNLRPWRGHWKLGDPSIIAHVKMKSQQHNFQGPRMTGTEPLCQILTVMW